MTPAVLFPDAHTPPPPAPPVEVDKSTANGGSSSTGSKRPGSDYWWLTSGNDIAHLMRESGYPDDVARLFLSYFRQEICPRLGDEVTSASKKSGLGWDGSPFEYGLELKSTGASQSVRFGLDLADLRASSPPPAGAAPHTQDPVPGGKGVLDTSGARRVAETLIGRTVDFDDTWYRSLLAFFDQSQQTSERQLELAAQVGHQTPLIIGFDLHPKMPSSSSSSSSSSPGHSSGGTSNSSTGSALPAMGKVYFTPCHAAAAKGQTRWQTICQAIHQLPDMATRHPALLDSLAMIDDYLATKPASWKDGARYLATDFVSPDRSRLKIYLRYPGSSFAEIWDYFTLGGRIPAPEEDKAMFRDLMTLTGPGCVVDDHDNIVETRQGGHGHGHGGDYTVNSDLDYTNFRRKMTCIYFSLSANNRTPAPKIGIYPANFAANDGVIARGLDAWLERYNWPLPKRSIEEQLKRVFTHRSLDEKTGLFTFISVGRKEDPTRKNLSMQIYLAPELYASPREWQGT